MKSTFRLADEPRVDAKDWERQLHEQHRDHLQTRLRSTQMELMQEISRIAQLEADAIIGGKLDSATERKFRDLRRTARVEYEKAVQTLRTREEERWQADLTRARTLHSLRGNKMADYLYNIDVDNEMDATAPAWLRELHQSHIMQFQDRCRRRYDKGMAKIDKEEREAIAAGKPFDSEAAKARFMARFPAKQQAIRVAQNEQLREAIIAADLSLARSMKTSDGDPSFTAETHVWRPWQPPRRMQSFPTRYPTPNPLPMKNDTSHLPVNLLMGNRIPHISRPPYEAKVPFWDGAEIEVHPRRANTPFESRGPPIIPPRPATVRPEMIVPPWPRVPVPHPYPYPNRRQTNGPGSGLLFPRPSLPTIPGYPAASVRGRAR